jgi:hypothetical protein
MELNIYSIPNGVNPPLPPPSNENSDNVASEGLGHRLMALVRTTEKTDIKQLNKAGELRSLLKSMVELFSRRGLLQGDVAKARKRLTSGSQSSTIGGAGRESKKGKNKRNKAIDDLRMINEADIVDTIGDGNVTDDEELILAGLSRILGGTQELSLPQTTNEGKDLLSIQLAARVCSAITHYIQLFVPDNSCASAEYELLASSGRNFLTGFARTIKALLSRDINESYESAKTLEICLASATSLISLFGTKLSRSSPIIEALRSLGWQSLCHSKEKIQENTSCLLASLTMTGMDSCAPSDAWTKAVADSISGTMLLIKVVAPVKTKASQSDQRLSEAMKPTVGKWIDQIRESLPNEAIKVAMLRTYVSGLIRHISALLAREFVPSQSKQALNATLLPMEDLLDLLECLLSYPSFAESAYYGTKKRLRFETTINGLLSPYAIATDVANFIKSMGLALFQVLLCTIGRPSLLQYGRRLISLCHMSIQTSCSTVLKKAIDPSGINRLEGKKRRWLHQSVLLRTKALQSAISTILVLGSNMVIESTSNPHARRSSSSNESGKVILLVSGCALEQINWDGKDTDWGTLGERVDLAATAVDALATILNSCGGFLSLKTRSLIDSVALTCLTDYIGNSRSIISSWSRTKVAVLNLGITCICTPWPDSAMSELTTTLRSTAQVLVNDSDRRVSLLALHGLQVCNMQCTYRAPPLCIVTRSTLGESVERNFEVETASAIVKGLELAKAEETQKPKQKLKAKRKSEEVKVDAIHDIKRVKPSLASPLIGIAKAALTIAQTTHVVESQVFGDKLLPEDPHIVEHFYDDVPLETMPKVDDHDGEQDVREDEGEDGDDFMPSIVDLGPDGDDED